MVIIDPYPLNPNNPFREPWQPDPYPFQPDVYPTFTGTYTVERIKEVEKKWKERHVKEVKKGILITFEGDEQPLFIATDDKCWSKIMEAIKDEPKKNDK